MDTATRFADRPRRTSIQTGVVLAAFCLAAAVHAQKPTKEYIYAGDRLIGIESYQTGVVLSPQSANVPDSGGLVTITVSAPAGVNWTAASNQSWAVVTSGGSGSGNGTTQITVGVNAGALRSASITVSGKVMTITQDRAQAADPPGVAPVSASPANSSGANTRFSFRMSGGSNARTMIVLFQPVIDGNESCFLSMDRVTGWWGLAESVGANWTGAGNGNPGWVSNLSCRIRTETASMTQSGQDWVFTIDIEFQPWVRGTMRMYSLAQEMGGATPAGWVDLGGHTPYPLPPVPSFSVSPVNPTGIAPIFRFRVESGVDGRFIRWTIAEFGTNINNKGRCTLLLNTYDERVYLGSWTGPTGISGSSGVLDSADCSVALSGTRMTADATGVTWEIPVTFKPAMNGSWKSYLTSFDRSFRWSPTAEVGTWTSTGPTISSIGYTATPVVAGDASRAQFLFTFGGGSNFGAGLGLISVWLNGRHSCFFSMDRRNNMIGLAKDDGQSWNAGFFGQSTVLENSLCRIRPASSSITANGDNWEARMDIEILPPMRGAQNVWSLAADVNGANAAEGWKQYAAYTPYAAPDLSTMTSSVTPSAATAQSLDFRYVIQTNADGRFARDGWMILNTTLATAGGCVLGYEILSKQLYVNPHSGGPVGVAGTTGTLSGTECSIDLAQSSISTDLDAATIIVRVTFAAGFTGAKDHWVWGTDRAGRIRDWVKVGTWGQAAAVASLENEAHYNVTVNSSRQFTARCNGATAAGVSWQILHKQGFASIDSTTANPVTLTANGIPEGGYISVQGTYSCGGIQRSVIGYLYLDYYVSPDGPNVSPSSGFGSNVAFNVSWSLSTVPPNNGVPDGTPIEFLIASNLSTANNTCYILYWNNTIYLRHDTEPTWLTIGLTPLPTYHPYWNPNPNPNSTLSVENSQCRFNFATSWTYIDGFNRRIRLPLILKPAFVGQKNSYARRSTADNTGTEGFVEIGSWVVTNP